MHPATVTVVCDNPTCPAYLREKNVGLQHLGQDVYLTGPLRCGECGSPDDMDLVDD